jgi:hypothetical protein
LVLLIPDSYTILFWELCTVLQNFLLYWYWFLRFHLCALYKYSLITYYKLITLPCMNLIYVSFLCIVFIIYYYYLYLLSRPILYCTYCYYNDMFYIHLWISGILNKWIWIWIWWFKSSGMWHCLTGWVHPDISEDYSASFFREISLRNWLCDAEDKGTVIPQNIMDFSPSHKVLYPRRFDSSILNFWLNTVLHVYPWTWYVDMIYLFTAIGLTPGGSSTVHIYTQTVHRTTQNIWLLQMGWHPVEVVQYIFTHSQ